MHNQKAAMMNNAAMQFSARLLDVSGSAELTREMCNEMLEISHDGCAGFFAAHRVELALHFACFTGKPLAEALPDNEADEQAICDAQMLVLGDYARLCVEQAVIAVTRIVNHEIQGGTFHKKLSVYDHKMAYAALMIAIAKTWQSLSGSYYFDETVSSEMRNRMVDTLTGWRIVYGEN